MVWKYRYRREYLEDATLVERLNDLGDQGWSLVGQPVWVPGDRQDEAAGLWRCFFKKTISNREQIQKLFGLSAEGTHAAR